MNRRPQCQGSGEWRSGEVHLPLEWRESLLTARTARRDVGPLRCPSTSQGVLRNDQPHTLGFKAAGRRYVYGDHLRGLRSDRIRQAKRPGGFAFASWIDKMPRQALEVASGSLRKTKASALALDRRAGSRDRVRGEA